MVAESPSREKICKVRLGYRILSVSRATNSRCSYAKSLLELTFACVSPEETSVKRRGGEAKVEKWRREMSVLSYRG